MKTDIFEADPFSARQGQLLLSLDTDYRFEKNDELTIEREGSTVPLRVTYVKIRIIDGKPMREIAALRL